MPSRTTASNPLDEPAGSVLLLEALAQGPSLLAILRGPGFVYEWASDRYRSLIGDADLVGKSYGLQSSDGGAASLIRHLIETCYRTGESRSLAEVRATVSAPEGGTREAFFDVEVHAVRDRSGAIDGVLIHSLERTADVRARAELRVAQAARAAPQASPRRCSPTRARALSRPSGSSSPRTSRRSRSALPPRCPQG